MDFTIISSCASTKYVRSLASVSVHRNDRGYCTGCRMQRGGLREPIGGGAKECLVTGVWAPNVGEPLDINWQPEGAGTANSDACQSPPGQGGGCVARGVP